MPKILIYITTRITWIFLFWGTDVNENRPHVHIGKKGTENLCKIWLEPTVEIAEKGDLTIKQQTDVLNITSEYKELLLKQWNLFRSGQKVKMITVKK